jgi:hypothetical protein
MWDTLYYTASQSSVHEFQSLIELGAGPTFAYSSTTNLDVAYQAGCGEVAEHILASGLWGKSLSSDVLPNSLITSAKSACPADGSVLHIASDLWERVSFDLKYRVRGNATFLCSTLEHGHIDVMEYVLSRVNSSAVRGLVSGEIAC